MPSIYDALATTWPFRLASDLAQGAMAPGNAYQSAPENPVTTEQMVAPAWNLAGLMAGQAPATATAGAAGIFGGRLAQTANHENLRLAEAMESSGLPTSQIRDATGWFRGADSKWRFEIPDNNLKVTPDSGPMHFSVEHPELYAAYPDLQLMQAKTNIGPLRGTYDFATTPPSIRATGQNPNELRAVTAHELQHAVQHIEGFDPGASVRQPMTFVASEGRHLDPYEFYKRNMGEVEARNVEKRLDYTPQQRAYLPPWFTQKVPTEQQLPNTDLIARMMNYNYWHRAPVAGM